MINIEITTNIKQKLDFLNKFNIVLPSDPRFTEDSAVKCIKSLADIFISEFSGYALGSEEFNKFVKGSTIGYRKIAVVSSAFARVIVCGFFQTFGTDRVVGDNIPEFGHQDFGFNFGSVVGAIFGDIINDQKTDAYIEHGLHVKLRKITKEDYFTNKFYLSDIDVAYSIAQSYFDSDVAKNILDAVANFSTCRTFISDALSDLTGIYTELFREGFGVEPYVGVYGAVVDSNSKLTIDNAGFVEVCNLRATKIRRNHELLKELGSRIHNKIKNSVVISSSRQFDYTQIYKQTDKVFYFPLKILEYASGTCSTIKLDTPTYMDSSYSVSWEKYLKGYCEPNLREVLTLGCYYAIEFGMKKRNPKFTFMDFAGLSDADSAEKVESCYATVTNQEVMHYLKALLNSMKCAYVLTKYGFLGGETTSIGLRVTVSSDFNCFQGGDSTVTTTYLFKNLISNNNYETFAPPIDVTNGVISSKGKVLSAMVLDMTYSVNPRLEEAEPLFGYVVQKHNQLSGQKSDWNRILIGKAPSGKEIYASPLDSEVPLQSNFIHNIYAGSRSGKGVMTMNLLVSAIAAGKPIFYLDRKPDMASVLAEMTNNKMFCINGSNWLGDHDVAKMFDPDNSENMRYWREKTKPYLQAHPEIGRLLVADGDYLNYTSGIGDIIYLRAVMFTLGIMNLRCSSEGTFNNIFEEFGGKNGIVIVIDELSGVQNKLSGIFGNFSSNMVQKAIELGDLDSALALRDSLKQKIQLKEMEISEARTETKRMKAEMELQELKKKLNTFVDDASLYAASFYSKLCENYSTFYSRSRAGYKNKEFSYSDIFVLGQDLVQKFVLQAKGNGIKAPVFFPMTSGNKGFYSEAIGADIIRSFFEAAPESDWFIGNYILTENQAVSDSGCSLVNRTDLADFLKKSNWAYLGRHGLGELLDKDASKSIKDVRFKSYLVLNKNFEDPSMNGAGDSQYVYQCANRCNSNAGIPIWETVRLKHLTEDVISKASESEPYYNHLQPGVGFFGLIKETVKTTGKTVSDEDIINILAKSGELANKVARAMGFENYLDLLFDLSPRGIFGFSDIENALLYPERYNLASRFPYYDRLDKMDLISGDINDNTKDSANFNNGVGSMFSGASPDLGFDIDSFLSNTTNFTASEDADLHRQQDYNVYQNTSTKGGYHSQSVFQPNINLGLDESDIAQQAYPLNQQSPKDVLEGNKATADEYIGDWSEGEVDIIEEDASQDYEETFEEAVESMEYEDGYIKEDEVIFTDEDYLEISKMLLDETGLTFKPAMRDFLTKYTASILRGTAYEV